MIDSPPNTVARTRAGRGLRRCLRAAAAALLLVLAGCSVKHTTKIQVPAKKAAARTANLDELLAQLDAYATKVRALSCSSVRLSYTSVKADAGKLEQYRSAPGYILLRRPDQLRLTIQNPVTKTSIAELASNGDAFSLWLPRDNKLYTGRNSARALAVEGGPSFGARPIHIFEAIAFTKGSEAGALVALAEDSDAVANYYVVEVFRQSGPSRLRPVRRIWFERSTMTVSSQKTFAPDGSISSVISYSNFTPVDGIQLPLQIKLERPSDGYTLTMEFKAWRLNPEIPGNAFVLTPPATAQKVELREKAD